MTRLLRDRRAPLIAAVGLLSVMLLARNDVVGLVLTPVAGACLVYGLAQFLATDRWLLWIALGRLILGAVVAVGLYWLSGLGLPGLSGLVVEKGFWVFGLDALNYHQRGLQIAHSLHHGVLFPEMDRSYGSSYISFVGLIYTGLGMHPLIPVFLNNVLAAITVVLVYRIAARSFPSAWARVAAAIAALWPSSYLWSSLLMKDTLSLFLFLLGVVLVVELLATGGSRRRLLGLGLGLFVTAVLLYTLRSYLVIGLLVVVVSVVGVAVLLRPRRLRGAHVVVVVALACSMLAGQRLGSNFLLLLLNPTGSETAQIYRGALALEKAGRLAESRARLEVVIERRPDFWPAYRNLGQLLIHLGEFDEAEDRLREYIRLNPYDRSAPKILEEVDRLAKSRARLAVAIEQQPLFAEREREGAVNVPAEAPAVDPFMMTSKDVLMRQLTRQEPVPNMALSSKLAAILRRGFIRTGGDSLYTQEPVPPDVSLWQWVKWAPQAFAAVVAAPYPWQWVKQGRLDPMRTAMGMESLVLVVLLPVAVVGALGLVRAGLTGATVVAVFFAFAVALGLIVTNIGTLVRLRLPVMFLLFVLAAAGAAQLAAWRRPASGPPRG